MKSTYLRYLFRDAYTNNIKLSLKKKAVVRPGSDGHIDSIRCLLSNEYNNDRSLINNLQTEYKYMLDRMGTGGRRPLIKGLYYKK